jgi:thiol-disulfide isomerase/thioredoxin
MRFFMIGLREDYRRMTDGRTKRRRAPLLLGIAAVAGILAGAVAVYVRESANGNGAGASIDCAGTAAVAARLSPLATGEVAAFRPADQPDLVRDLSFTTPDGAQTSVAAFAGKTILLNLWATWCVPCRAEMPALDRLEGALGSDRFQVVPVNVDLGNPERARAFLGEIGVSHLGFYADPSFAIVKDLKKRGLALGLPTTILVDGKGCRVGGIEGPAAWDSQDAKALIAAATAPG